MSSDVACGLKPMPSPRKVGCEAQPGMPQGRTQGAPPGAGCNPPGPYVPGPARTAWQTSHAAAQGAAGTGPRRLPPPRPGRAGVMPPPHRAFPALWEVVDRHHPQPDVVVTVARLVPVAVGAANVPRFIIERATAQHAAPLSARPHTKGNHGSCPYVPIVCLIQPPNIRPISATIAAAWRYCSGDIHFHLAVIRR